MLHSFARTAIKKITLTRWLKTTEIYFLTVLEAKSPRSRCQQVWFLLRLLSLPSRQLPSHCVLTRPFLSVRAPWPFSSSKGIRHIELGLPHPYDLLRDCIQYVTKLENSAVATGLEKVSFLSNPKQEWCQRIFKLLYNCIHFTYQ